MKHFRLILLLSFVAFSCQKELSFEGGPVSSSATLPTITTTAVTSITNTTATTGGTISADGGAPVTGRGVCWSVTSNPVITANQHTIQGTGTGVFATTLAALNPNTLYYARAYATNSAGTAYGNEISFTTTTTSTALPTVTTASIGSITALSASCGGTVSADGGAPVTVRGICWSTSANPVATGTHTTDGAGLGVFAGYISGLTAGTTYHVRAYATNSVGTAYGGDSVFTTANVPGGPDVYVVGREFNGTADVAKIWKNGVGTTLSGGIYKAIANGVYVSGTDVYVAGWESNGSKEVAKVWKNGIATALTNGSLNGFAESVFVSGNDVYVTGTESGGMPIAKVWKNGTATVLSTALCGAIPRSVFVSGADVFVGGGESNCTKSIAKIWQNGVAVSLPFSSFGDEIFSVFVAGTDVYACGTEKGLGNDYFATVWKNGVSTALTTGKSVARSILVSGGDVYVAGYESNGTHQIAKYWKNGVATSLGDGTTDTFGTCIFVLGSDVYVAGREAYGGMSFARVWKNAVLTTLASGAPGTEATSIFVK